MRSLRGRIGVALFVFALITLIVVGGTLWVALRDLHRDAALGSLAELTVPYSSQARQRFPLEVLRPRQPGERPGPEVARRFRDTQQGRRASVAFTEFVSQTQDEIDAAGVSVLLISEDSVIVRDPVSGDVGFLASSPDVEIPEFRGDVTTGSTEIEGIGAVLYAATPVRDARSDRVIPALVLVREDQSAALATADLFRALTIAAVFLLILGIPIAYGLSRSVTRPLGRLAAASGAVAKGEVPEQLPTTGPSEVADASEAFNAMAAEVDSTRQAQRQLLADVRHDLRTPLTVIGGFSEALRDGTATGPAADRAADAIADEAARLERMLDDLDHLTGSDTQGPPLRIETLDGVTIAEETVGRFLAQADNQGQVLTVSSDLDTADLLADRDAVDRILGNIVVNALSHAPVPGGAAQLEVALVPPGQAPGSSAGGWSGGAGVMLAIHDDGPGIAETALPHVFDRFYRADPSRSSPGSGLGLAIVRDLAEALDGIAFAENPNGGGARVGVILPAATPVEVDRGAA